MQITLKKATLEDMEDCIAVEKKSMPNHCYLKDVWSYFQGTVGDLSCVYVDGVLAGIGKFTLLYDGTGWLETLRVDPKYQGMGVGKEIYKRYLEQGSHYNCPRLEMYTGVENRVSAGLAIKHGLSKVQEFRGYNLTEFTPPTEDYSFQIVDPQRAAQLILPLSEAYHGYMVSNRTFYRINPPTAEGFGMDGKVFEDAKGNFIVCGARFQHLKALHISMMGGDLATCLGFAKKFACSHGIPKLTVTFALPNQALEQCLIEQGFEKEPSDHMTMAVTL